MATPGVKAKARRDVVSHFMRAKAVSKENAISYEPGRRIRLRFNAAELHT